ncbi:MAG TPA: hypothetical protein VGP81_04235, partial [Pyrinomonadaceae bacterium]|nr:hypothetical protein [Pyrinomonadaceae bacterium]
MRGRRSKQGKMDHQKKHNVRGSDGANALIAYYSSRITDPAPSNLREPFIHIEFPGPNFDPGRLHPFDFPF